MITTKLENGATIVAEIKINNDHYVVAQFHTDESWVTWKLGEPLKQNGAYPAFWGHYFDTQAQALKDLRGRAFGGAS